MACFFSTNLHKGSFGDGVGRVRLGIGENGTEATKIWWMDDGY